jgi:hypothetical protein
MQASFDIPRAVLDYHFLHVDGPSAEEFSMRTDTVTAGRHWTARGVRQLYWCTVDDVTDKTSSMRISQRIYSVLFLVLLNVT